jgi:hypothetical protein
VAAKINNVSDNVSGIFLNFADKQKDKSNLMIKRKEKDDDERTNG